MILSHAHKFIFLKTTKTAGTSVEIALSRFCGEDDVLTPLAPEDEETRRALGHRGAQNHRAPLSEYGIRDVIASLSKRRLKRKYYNHMSAREVRQNVGERIWRDYYKFCIERNPWDRCVSFYYWRNRTEPRPAFAEYMKSRGPEALKRKGFGLYTIDGEVAVDRVCSYETLTDDLEQVRLRLGLPAPLLLPTAKASIRADRRNYRDIIDPASRDHIAALFRDGIALFSYEF